jgi:hypothetical protein
MKKFLLFTIYMVRENILKPNYRILNINSTNNGLVLKSFLLNERFSVVINPFEKFHRVSYKIEY